MDLSWFKIQRKLQGAISSLQRICEIYPRPSQDTKLPIFSELTMSGSLRFDEPLKHMKQSVFTRKTEVSPGGEYEPSNQERTVEDPVRLCPIHSKPHPLRKWCGFRNKTLDRNNLTLKIITSDSSVPPQPVTSPKTMTKLNCAMSATTTDITLHFIQGQLHENQ